MLQSNLLLEIPHLRHGFFGRDGGVSSGIYSSLNCGYGSGDNNALVSENRKRVVSLLSPDFPFTLVTCSQIHSNKAVMVKSAWQLENAPQADAMVTDNPNIALGILTADCLPVLFADRKKRIIGAAHSGWRGALCRVLEATISAMQNLGANDIIAAIGPSIQQESYEVGAEFREKFLSESQKNEEFFKISAKSEHYLFDLPEYAKNRLLRAGISEIEHIKRDTYLDEHSFFSYRRATIAGENSYGRQISVIAQF